VASRPLVRGVPQVRILLQNPQKTIADFWISLACGIVRLLSNLGADPDVIGMEQMTKQAGKVFQRSGQTHIPLSLN
jgi:hypothetical protein